jgi:hypothetical protein
MFADHRDVRAVLGFNLSAVEVETVNRELAPFVTEAARSYMRRTISRVDDDDAVLQGVDGRKLVLGERPVHAVGPVTVDGVEVADFRWTRRGALWRDAGWGGPAVEVEVTYSHGFDTVPDDLRFATATACARLVVQRRAQESASGEGMLGVASVSVEGYEVTYPADRALATFGFTIGELCVLDRYRRRVWPS